MPPKSLTKDDLKCPEGHIMREGHMRKGYVRKNGTEVKATYVKPKCIPDPGEPGRYDNQVGQGSQGSQGSQDSKDSKDSKDSPRSGKKTSNDSPKKVKNESPSKKKSQSLKRYGYDVSKETEARHEAIRKAMENETNPGDVISKITAIYALDKDESVTKKISSDTRYADKLYKTVYSPLKK